MIRGKMNRYKPVGWRYESHRHSLAAKGIRTSFATPSMKSPSMEKFLDEMSEKTYGRTRTGSIKKDICVECGGPAKSFRDDVSRREYPISGLCQKCQDKVFKKSMAGKEPYGWEMTDKDEDMIIYRKSGKFYPGKKGVVLRRVKKDEDKWTITGGFLTGTYDSFYDAHTAAMKYMDVNQ